MTRIEAENLTKSFTQSSGSPLLVLDEITFTTEENDFVCILGPSGCGKSTLLNLIAGLDTPTSGSINLDGNSPQGTVSFVFQEPRLLDWRTVNKNIELVLEGMGVPESEWAERIDRYLDLVGLSEFKEEYPQSLSGGMKQRVAIARAMATETDVILMDEPFGSLDEITARELRDDLIQIWQENERTITFVTHNALEATYLANNVLVMSDRPAKISDSRSVDFNRPRDRDDPELLSLSEELIENL